MKQRMVCVKLANPIGQETAAKLLSFLQSASYEDVREFLTKLRNCTEPPVLYYCEYIDYWSSGFLLSQAQSLATFFCWSSPDTSIELLCFFPLDIPRLIGLRDLWKQIPDPSPETCWFVEIFSQAVLSWEGIVKGDCAVLLVRMVVGATLLDSDINKTSCDLF